MFNSIILNVVIGMVFIYLLYSLLITILSEIVSQSLMLRASLLKKAITRMLNDGFDEDDATSFFKSPVKYFRNIFARFTEDFENSFAGKFYNDPSIKYLTEGPKDTVVPRRQKIPSYISRDYFAQTLMHFFRNNGFGPTDSDKIKSCLKLNTLQIEPQTLDYINNLFTDAGQEINVFMKNIMKWFDETMDRTNGWYKKQIKWISFGLGFIIAVTFNVDSIKLARLLAKDSNARDQLASMGVAAVKDSAKFIGYMRSDGETVNQGSLIDSSLKTISADIKEANMVLGLGWDFSKLNKEDSARVIPNNFIDSILVSFHELNRSIVALSQKVTQRTVRDSSNQANVKSLAALKEKRNVYLKMINDSLGTRFVSVQSASSRLTNGKNVFLIKGKAEAGFWSKLGFIIIQSLPDKISFWGFLITALMLSLGAPFWFDLLKKLVSLRGVGVKPEEKAKDQTAEDILTVTNNRQAIPNPISFNNLLTIAPPSDEDVIDDAIAQYAAPMLAIPGVRSVMKAKLSVDNIQKDFMQVNVSDKYTWDIIKNKFPSINQKLHNNRFTSLCLKPDIEVPVAIVNSGTPTARGGVEGQIINETGIQGFGTLGCVLTDTKTHRSHLLSCWHVMKGDSNLFETDGYTKIYDNHNHYIADRWGGGIFDCFDYGLAICLPDANLNNNELKEKLGRDPNSRFTVKPVTRNDISKRIPVRMYDCFSGNIKKGIIYSGGYPVQIDYETEEPYFVNDVIVLTDNVNNRSLSQEGNSGAIVFDENNNALAMIIAGDDLYSYAIRLSKIFNLHQNLTIG